MDNITLAFRIKQLRLDFNLTQTEFAQKINITQAALSAYEKGDRTPSLEVLTAIANNFGISLDWLCGLTDQKNASNFKTYSDVFRTIIGLLAVRTTSEGTDMKAKITHHLIHYHGNGKTTFDTDDPNFSNFFPNWIKMKKLLSDKTIDKELYELWLEKELAKYDRPINGFPF